MPCWAVGRIFRIVVDRAFEPLRQPSHLVVMLFGERQKHPKPPRIRSADSAVARLTSASTDCARGLRSPATALGEP
jgi:hypothetical protein